MIYERDRFHRRLTSTEELINRSLPPSLACPFAPHIWIASFTHKTFKCNSHRYVFFSAQLFTPPILTMLPLVFKEPNVELSTCVPTLDVLNNNGEIKYSKDQKGCFYFAHFDRKLSDGDDGFYVCVGNCQTNLALHSIDLVESRDRMTSSEVPSRYPHLTHIQTYPHHPSPRWY